MLIAVSLTSYLTKSVIYGILGHNLLCVMRRIRAQRPLNFGDIALVKQRFDPSRTKQIFYTTFSRSPILSCLSVLVTWHTASSWYFPNGALTSMPTASRSPVPSRSRNTSGRLPWASSLTFRPQAQETPGSYWPSLPNPVGSVRYDGVRTCLPLRGSPGFAPGSLLRRPTEAGRTKQCGTIYRGAK